MGKVPKGRKNMNKKKLFIIASILAAIGLVVMLFMLPKPKTNNSAKPISTETSTSKKNDKKDNKQDEKKDSKKDDKKEDKKEDTSTTSSETTATPTTGTTTTETQNNNNSTPVTTTTNTTPSQPEPQPIYQTIHHDAVGHWETQVIQEEWDQPIYERKIIGNQTGTIYSNVDEFAFNTNGDGSYHVGDVQVGTTHHDAVTQEVWVVDQAAWDQTVIVGYR